MNRLIDELKVDAGLTPVSLNGAGTGPYYKLDNQRKVLFAVTLGAMAAAATSALQAMQAVDAAGTSAKVITGKTATVTANTSVQEAKLTLLNVAVADKVTINGLTFTAAAAADLANRVFDQSGNDDADAVSLAAAINHSVAGVPGVKATASAGGVVTLSQTEPGNISITITNASATITPATVKAVGYVEVDASQLDLANGFSHVALRVTNSAAILTGVAAIRGMGRYTPVQYAAASYA